MALVLSPKTGTRSRGTGCKPRLTRGTSGAVASCQPTPATVPHTGAVLGAPPQPAMHPRGFHRPPAPFRNPQRRLRWAPLGALVLAACNQLLGIESAQRDDGMNAPIAGAAGAEPTAGNPAGATAGDGATAGAAGSPIAGASAGGGEGGTAGAVTTESGGAETAGSAGTAVTGGSGGAAGGGGGVGGSAGATVAGSAGVPGPGGAGTSLAGSAGAATAGAGAATVGGSAGAGGATTSCEDIDLENDAENCGRCRHSCLGTACVEGRCIPELVATYPHDIGGAAVTTTAAHVVWGADDLTWLDRDDPFGVAPATHVLDSNALNEVRWLVATRQYVFAGDDGTATGGGVYRAPVAGGDATHFEALPELGAMAADETNAYLASCDSPTTILRWSGELRPQVLWSGADLPCPADMQERDGRLWMVSLDSTSVYSLAIDAAAEDRPEVRGGLVHSNRRIAVDAEYGFVAAVYDDFSGEVFRFSLASAGAATLLVPLRSQSSPYDLVLDDDYVYWVNLGTYAGDYEDGSLCRAPKDNPSQAVEVLVDPLPAPRSIAIDGPWIYWVDGGLGDGRSLWRVAR
jgi:hypothetical protein